MKCNDMNQVNEVMKQLLGADSIDKVLTPEEENTLWACSYQHKFGVFIRLELMTGIRLGELVALHWSDFSHDGVLNIDMTLITLPTSYEDGSKEIPGFARKIMLPVQLCNELIFLWRNVQTADIISAGIMYDNIIHDVTNRWGHPMTAGSFLREYWDIIRAANIRQLPFDALRNTYVYNALRNGVDSDIIAAVLGVQPSGFPKVASLHQDMNYIIPEVTTSKSYPIIVTPKSNGCSFYVVDFDDIECSAKTVAEGVSKIVNAIRSKYGNMVLPEPTAAHMIKLRPEEYIVMATVSP